MKTTFTHVPCSGKNGNSKAHRAAEVYPTLPEVVLRVREAPPEELFALDVAQEPADRLLVLVEVILERVISRERGLLARGAVAVIEREEVAVLAELALDAQRVLRLTLLRPAARPRVTLHLDSADRRAVLFLQPCPAQLTRLLLLLPEAEA